MSQKDTSHFTFSSFLSADTNHDWILDPHESGSSTQATEIDPIEEELDSLTRSEALLTQQYAQILEKRDKIKLGKQPEQLSELETEIKYLREEAEVEPGELELKLLLARNFMNWKQRKQAVAKVEESHVGSGVAHDITEAEVKGLRHVGFADERPRKQDDADTQRKLELIRRVQEDLIEIEELEAGGGKSIQRCVDTIAPPKLSFSAVTTGACTAPIETEDDETEIEELREHLSTVELDNTVLMTHLTISTNSYRQLVADFDAAVEHVHTLRETNLSLTTRNENLVSQLEAQTQLLRTKDQDTQQQVAQAKAEVAAEYQARIDALEAQRQRTYSIFSDPDFVASLHDSNASIHSLSRSLTPTVPCSSPCCAGSTAAQAPNATLNISLRPNDTRLWSLLRHVHRSVFWTSLNIDGPQRLVQEFVASIEQAEREFEEQAQRVARMERVISYREEGLEMLRERLG